MFLKWRKVLKTPSKLVQYLKVAQCAMHRHFLPPNTQSECIGESLCITIGLPGKTIHYNGPSRSL